MRGAAAAGCAAAVNFRLTVRAHARPMAEDLRNADLSDLSVRNMTPEQRAELRRRFRHFLQNVWKAGSRPVAAPPKKVRRWVPTKRV